MNENESFKIEAPSATALEQMERVAIDVQITTAKRYPRSIAMVKAAMLTFATLDVETAASCFYTLPARKGGDGKPLQGPSIRMAEIALACYQNLRAGARVIADDGKMITAQGVCHDLQNNVYICVEVNRRVTGRDGRRYSDDMIVVTGNAACSIALRNATFRVVPLALVKPVYEQAKRVAVGDAKTLVTRRADALAVFAKMGVPKEKVLAVVNAAAPEDIGLDSLEILLGYYTAIKDGDASIDEIFNASIATDEKPASAMFSAKKAETKTTPPPKTEVPPADKPAINVADSAAGTPQQALEQLLSNDYAVSFDDFRSFIAIKNIAPGSDSWGGWSEVPTMVVNAIRGKTTDEIVHKYGKKKA